MHLSSRSLRIDPGPEPALPAIPEPLLSELFTLRAAGVSLAELLRQAEARQAPPELLADLLERFHGWLLDPRTVGLGPRRPPLELLMKKAGELFEYPEPVVAQLGFRAGRLVHPECFVVSGRDAVRTVRMPGIEIASHRLTVTGCPELRTLVVGPGVASAEVRDCPRLMRVQFAGRGLRTLELARLPLLEAVTLTRPGRPAKAPALDWSDCPRLVRVFVPGNTPLPVRSLHLARCPRLCPLPSRLQVLGSCVLEACPRLQSTLPGKAGRRD